MLFIELMKVCSVLYTSRIIFLFFVEPFLITKNELFTQRALLGN